MHCQGDIIDLQTFIYVFDIIKHVWMNSMNNIEMIMIVYIFLILYNGDKEKEIYNL